MKPFASLAFIALASWSLAAQGGPAAPEPRTTLIRVAYTTFESPERVRERQTLEPIFGFLDRTGESLTRTTGRRIEFEVVLGNPYQVWSWFRARQIDAAIISPFMAYLLERDGSALSILELIEHDPEGSYATLVSASGSGRSNPRAAFRSHLQRILDDAEQRREQDSGSTRLNLVAHLSESGFIMPTLYAQQWLNYQKRQPSPDVRDRFWHMFFERSRFTLHNGLTKAAPGAAVTDIFFSYTGRPGSSLDADIAAGDLGQWDPLFEADPDFSAPRIPPDLLVVRRRLAEELLKSVDRAELADRFVQIASRVTGFGENAPYKGIRRFNMAAQSAFRAAVESVFGPRAPDPVLRRLNERWFERARFDFTIDETVDFLRQDQLNSGVARLALVLSGGGVKSLYQARILDELYQRPGSLHPTLRNFHEEPFGSNELTSPAAGPLTVHTIIGTSGGAMLAFFAALIPSSEFERLTEILTATASRPLFPAVDIPRVISILAILLIFVVSLHTAKALGWMPVRTGFTDPWHIPRSAPLLLGAPLVLIASALLIRVLRVPHLDVVMYIRETEGFLYSLTAVLIHVAAVCITRLRSDKVETVPVRAASGRLGIAIGLSVIFTAVVLRMLVSGIDPTDEVLVGLPILASAGIVLTIGSVTIAASGGWRGFGLVYAREYLAALGVVGVVVASSYVGVLFARAAELSTFLELTWSFWLWTGLGGLLVSAVLLLLTRTRWRVGNVVGLGSYTLVHDRVGGLTLTVGAAMTTFYMLAALLWIALVAPAVYGSDQARRALEDALPLKTRLSGAFRANLIVTGALLANTRCAEQQREYVAGPLYSCFEGPASCVTASPHWETFRRPVPGRALEAVFASGSPFPVFPAHKVPLPNGCIVPLIDGGYAHNVPLEAAVEAEARQALVINASPDPADGVESGTFERFMEFALSDLAQGAQRIFPFLFSRAQELDRSMARRLMVAAISPHPDNGDWPSLLDFRPSQRTRVVQQAESDVRERHRIGHIESWGIPVTHAVVRPSAGREPSLNANDGGLPASAGWLAEVREGLGELLQLTDKPVAVFDLDDTCLRGDLDDALFLKIVAELQYPGERDEFWKLIPDPQVRSTLRNYWQRFAALKADPAWHVHYAHPSTWPDEFKDYIALFLRQYRHFDDQPDGERGAHAWMAQLMAGMSADRAAGLSRELWLQEGRRGMSAQTIHSQRYGDFVIKGGVRVHEEVADLIKRLNDARWQTWIVASTNQYLAEEAAAHLGIPADRVAGIRPLVVDSLLTSNLQEPIASGEGKRHILIDRQLKPLLAAGDSMSDYEMLRLAPTVLVIDGGRIDPARMTTPTRWLVQPVGTLSLRSTY